MSLTELQKEYSFMNDMQQKAVFKTEGPVLLSLQVQVVVKQQFL